MNDNKFLLMMLVLCILLSACQASSLTSVDQFQNAEPPPTSTQNMDDPEKVVNGLPTSTVTFLPEQPPPPGAVSEFSSDFQKHTVPYDEILSGGPPKDGIPAIDQPSFVPVGAADAWLQPVEPVVMVTVGQDARAYPVQILIWHEIVNDTVGGLPLVVTFCPLCNTAIAFERRVDSQVLDFGTTGRLRYSNLIMYDRQTETWWQQASGEAIAGEMSGRRLVFYPAAMISWADFKEAYPTGKVLSKETGFSRPYGNNPYAGYDDVNQPPFLYDGPQTPGVLPPVARVLTIDLQGQAAAYPYDVLKDERVVNDLVANQPVVVFWAEGTASALDAGSVAGGRDVGAANAFSRVFDGQVLAFSFQNGHILDEQTGSRWNVLGQASSGELAGSQLDSIVAINHFWFSWAAFRPETRVYQP